MIMSIPMLKAIKIANPHSELGVICWDRSYNLINEQPFIDFCISTDKKYTGNNFWNPDNLIISFVGAIPSIVDTISFKVKNIHRLSEKVPPYTKHESEYKMGFARELGYNGDIPNCLVDLNENNVLEANSIIQANKLLNSPFICINASYLKTDHWHYKHWGNNNYTQLINKISETHSDIEFVFLGLKEDWQDAHEIIQNSLVKERCINSCGHIKDIKTLAALIKKSKCLIGNDSGLSHLAASIDTFNITIFRFTNIVKNHPLGDKSFIVAKDCDERIMCQHDVKNIESKCSKSGCLNIDVDKVIGVFNKIYA